MNNLIYVNRNILIMKSDEAIQRDVQQALKWQPELNVASIGVAVQNGIVTLSGTVSEYGEKKAAEQAVKYVSGVKAIVEEIEVYKNNTKHPTDQEIAQAITDAYKWRWDIPENHLHILVADGKVTLEGEVTWYYQKEAARETAARILGVRKIDNKIEIKPSKEHNVQVKDIESALWRNPDIDDDDISIEVQGNKVILKGEVPTLVQREEAARMAWSAPGVGYVENLLEVSS